MDENEEKIRYFRIIINGVWVDIDEEIWFKNVHLFGLNALLWVYEKCEYPFSRYAYNEIKRRWDTDKHKRYFIDLWDCVKKNQEPFCIFAFEEILERSATTIKTAGIIKKSLSKRH